MAEASPTRDADSSAESEAAVLPATSAARPRRWSAHRTAGLLVLVLFLGIVTGGSWFGLRYIERQTRENTGDSLHIVVAETQESLRAWYHAEREYVEHFSRDPRLVELTRRLLKLPRDHGAMPNGGVSDDLRACFRERGMGHDDLGFSLVSPERTNIFSMRGKDRGPLGSSVDNHARRSERARRPVQVARSRDSNAQR